MSVIPSGSGASSCICSFFFSSRRRHTRWNCDWSSDVCSSDLMAAEAVGTPVMNALGRPIKAAFRALTPTRTIGRIAGESMTPSSADVVRTAEGRVMPHEVSDSGLLHFLGNIVEGSPFSRQTAENFVKDRRQMFVRQAEDLITERGHLPRADPQDAGELIKQARIGQASSRAAAMTRSLDERTAQASEDALIQAKAIRATAEDEYLRAVGETDAAMGAVRGRFGATAGVEQMGDRTLQAMKVAHDLARKEASQIYNQA